MVSTPGDEYKSMKVDESKLSQAEQERLAFIQKLSLEADEIIKAAGFSLNDEELDEKMVRVRFRVRFRVEIVTFYYYYSISTNPNLFSIH
jgi:hypothetical protein